MFDELFPHRSNAACKQDKRPDGSTIPGGFYEYAALEAAASYFPGFLTEGTLEQRKRELAAFLGQISHETTGGGSTAPGGAQAWGLCWKEEVGCEGGQCTLRCAPSSMTPTWTSSRTRTASLRTPSSPSPPQSTSGCLLARTSRVATMSWWTSGRPRR